MAKMIDAPTVYAGCVDGMAIGAALTNFVDAHVGILLTYSSALTGVIAWAFMGG